MKNRKYTVDKIIGSGTFGIIAKGYSYDLKRDVAIKKLEKFTEEEY